LNFVNKKYQIFVLKNDSIKKSIKINKIYKSFTFVLKNKKIIKQKKNELIITKFISNNTLISEQLIKDVFNVETIG
jgi:hypothetical protein